MVCAMLCAVPSELAIACVRLLKSASLALTIASRPDIASLPAMPAAYSAFCASVNPANFCRRSIISADNGLTLPWASVRDTLSASIYAATASDGFARLVSAPRSAVPAFSPLMPALAIRPIATAVSSILYPSAPATGATYWKVFPIRDTLVLELEEAFASTSAKCVESLALSPNAVSASVTMSDTSANSSPDAAAKFMMPGRPPII